MLRATAVIREDDSGFHVDVHWSGAELDRPHTFGWLLGPKKRKLAERLKRAVDAQVVCLEPRVVTDINGKTYVADRHMVLARHANADLTRLGY